MRTNISEELVIEPRDGSELKPELEKEAKKLDKEIDKDLEKKEKEVKDINDAKAPDLNLKDTEGKRVKIKGLTERLTLEEPSDILNEDLSDKYNDEYFDAVHDVFQVIYNFYHKNSAYMHDEGIKILDDAESICDEAIMHLEEITDEFGELVEEVKLDEKIPHDLAGAYKRSRYKGALGDNTDLENANYTEVTPEEGYKAFKQDPTSVRLVVRDFRGNDVLVDFRSNGKQSKDHRIQYLPDDLAFINRKGDRLRDTLYIPQKHLFKIASKVYITNENNTPRNAALKAARQANRQKEAPTQDLTGNYIDRGRSSWRYSGRREDILNRIARLKDQLARKDELGLNDWQIKDREEDLRGYYNALYADQDRAALNRYGDSAAKLREPFDRYYNLKNQINNAKYDVDSKKRELDKVKNSGSDQVRRDRDRLNDLKNQLNDIRRQIALCELKLEDADEQDTGAIQAAENSFNAAISRYDNLQAELNTLLRR